MKFSQMKSREITHNGSVIKLTDISDREKTAEIVGKSPSQSSLVWLAEQYVRQYPGAKTTKIRKSCENYLITMIRTRKTV